MVADGSLRAPRAGRRRATAYQLGDSYIDRLPDHRGYWLVPVDDAVAAPRPTPPRHTIVIVVDGERYDAAHGMASAARLAKLGTCAPTNVGTISVSRPVYALLSTGLEVDRTGARNNDDKSPLAAESIWEIARQSGLVVKGIGELPWWRELFPRGFDDFTVAPDTDDHFANLGARLGDLNLIHPVYVDETGHDHGAASPEYRAAVARVDGEIGRLLDQVDFERDLVVLTADHGHSPTGGHGGMAPEIVTVLTCFAQGMACELAATSRVRSRPATSPPRSPCSSACASRKTCAPATMISTRSGRSSHPTRSRPATSPIGTRRSSVSGRPTAPSSPAGSA